MNQLPVISFLASHGGSSARFLIGAMQRDELDATPGMVVTNNRDSAIFHWCLEQDFPVRHISSKTHRGADNADEAICDVLRTAGTDIVVCSGYMKVIGPRLLDTYAGRILNIHPALLPKHGGKGMYGDFVHSAVLAAGDRVSGATVHIVCAGIDEGPILLQSHVAVEAGDTVETLRARVQATEPQLYLAAVKKFIKEFC